MPARSAGLPTLFGRRQVEICRFCSADDGTSCQLAAALFTQSTRVLLPLKQRLPATGPSIDRQFHTRTSLFCSTRDTGAGQSGNHELLSLTVLPANGGPLQAA